jgi:hypothetical protein
MNLIIMSLFSAFLTIVVLFKSAFLFLYWVLSLVVFAFMCFAYYMIEEKSMETESINFISCYTTLLFLLCSLGGARFNWPEYSHQIAVITGCVSTFSLLINFTKSVTYSKVINYINKILL